MFLISQPKALIHLSIGLFVLIIYLNHLQLITHNTGVNFLLLLNIQFLLVENPIGFLNIQQDYEILFQLDQDVDMF